MTFTRLAVASAFALASASSMAAALGPLDLSTGSASFGNTPIIGSFVDTLTFTLTQTSTLNGSVTSVVNGNQDVDFSSIAITGTSGTSPFSLQLGDPVEVWATPAAGFTLGAGSYTLTLTGVNSVGGGSYGGNLAVTAVPEPETLALMLAGIGAVATVVRRRRSS